MNHVSVDYKGDFYLEDNKDEAMMDVITKRHEYI